MALIAPPTDVTLALGQSRRMYLEGEFTQNCLVTLPQSGFLNLNIQLGESDPNAQATIRFVSGTFATTYMSETLSHGNNNIQLGDWFDAGNYYLLISIIPDNGNLYWPITYTVTTGFTGTDAAVGNSSVTSARGLALGSSYIKGLLSRTNNESWWKVTMPASGFLEIALKSYVSSVDAYVLQIRNGQRTNHYIDMNVVGGSDSVPKIATSGDWLEAGDYYLCINGGDSNTGLYDVMATFTAANNVEGTNNNTYLHPVKLVVNGGAWRCLLSQTDEIDVFSFTVPSPTTINIKAQAFMSALNLQLFNANMHTLIADGSASGTGGTMNRPNVHQITATLEAGTYTIMASRDAEGPRGIFHIEVNSVLTVSSVVVNASLFNLGDTISATVYTNGGRASQYTYHLQVQDPVSGAYRDAVAAVTSAYPSYNMVPSPGVYRLLVEASDGYRTVSGTSDPFTVKASMPLAVTGVMSDKDTLTTKEAITFIANVSGSIAAKQSIFQIYDATNNTVGTVTVTGNKGVYWPKKAGTYRVMAVATNGPEWASAWGPSFTVTAAPTFTITNIAMSTETNISIRTPMTITCSYANSKPTAWTYEVYYNGNFLQRFGSTSAQFMYTPTMVGDYKFMAVATDGVEWTSRWSDTIAVYDKAPLTITRITPSATNVNLNGSVTFDLAFSGGSKVRYTQYQLWNSADVKVDEWTGNSNSHTFTFAVAGVYRVMVVVNDGPNWTAKFSSNITVAAPTPIVMGNVTADKSKAEVGEIVNFHTDITSGTPTRYEYYIYTAANALVTATPSSSASFRYFFNKPGTYKVMVVTTDGYNWASVWGPSITVSSRSQLQFTSLAADATSKVYPQAVVVTPAFTGGNRVIQTTYEVYNATTNTRIATWTGRSGYFTFVPKDPSITSYRIMAVATDGEVWVSKFSPTITYTIPKALTVANVTNNTTNNTLSLGQSVTFKGVVADGAPLTFTEFKIMRKVKGGVETMVDRVSGNSKTYTFTPDTVGEYRVYFVAHDGITWDGKYSLPITVTD